LRNLMDMCVVSALVARHDLVSAAGCELPMLLGAKDSAAVDAWNVPKAIATQCSFAKHGREYVITASGGVQIESWQVASRTEVGPQMAPLRRQSASMTSNWWWQ
jgi:hypothetical protein